MLLKAVTHLVYLKFEYRAFMTKLPSLTIRVAFRPVVILPPGDFFGCHNQVGFTGIYWVKARDAANA